MIVDEKIVDERSFLLTSSWVRETTITSVPSVTNVYYFFYGLARRVSFRSLRLRLRQCLLWCRVHVCCRAAVWPRICGAAHSHTAALHSSAHLYTAAQFYVLPRPMVPR